MENNEKDRNTTHVKVPKALMGLLVAMLVFSTVISGLYLADRLTGGAHGDDIIDQGPTRENDVIIDDEYTIKDTTAISDAYKAGKPEDNDLSEKDREVLAMAAEVLDGTEEKDGIIKDGMTDLEKETAVYDWMVKTIKFDEGMSVLVNDTAESGTPYGALKNHKAVCVGYATTFRLFMQMLDIECMVVHDLEYIHSWDLVKIDDHWYHVDIYSDAEEEQYGHFNLNDELMASLQDWDMDFFPKADSLEANWGYQHREHAENVYALPELIKSALTERRGVLYVDFASKPTDAEEEAAESMVYAIMDALMDGRTSPFGGFPTTGSWQDGEDDTAFFAVSFMYYDSREGGDIDEAEVDLGDAEKKQATEALQKAFGDIKEDISIQDGFGYVEWE